MKYLVLDKNQWDNALEGADYILKYTLLLPDSTTAINTDPSSQIPDSLENFFHNCISKFFIPILNDAFSAINELLTVIISA